MNIRTATENDIPAIVELLKQSLGESMMPKSVAYWRWKHILNPFGQSPVLVSEESDGTLSGVRAFMHWQWNLNGNTFKAIRAVDTATHPAFQGKGIFKKLTLSLVDRCKEDGYHFVFNTPNSSSKPGYLKMGWDEAGRLPVKIKVKPLNAVTKIFSRGSATQTAGVSQKTISLLSHPGLGELLYDHQRQCTGLVTNISPAYLKWRYLDVPVATYTAVGHEEGNKLKALIVGRTKSTKFGTEFRITDFFMAGSNDGRQILKALKSVEEELKVDFTTIAGTIPLHCRKMLSAFFSMNAGPVVTIRNLNYNAFNDLKSFKNWTPALGDMELF